MRAHVLLVTALASMLAHPARTALTILGIVIGVASVIAVVAVGAGSRKAMEERLQSIGEHGSRSTLQFALEQADLQNRRFQAGETNRRAFRVNWRNGRAQREEVMRRRLGSGYGENAAHLSIFPTSERVRPTVASGHETVIFSSGHICYNGMG